MNGFFRFLTGFTTIIGLVWIAVLAWPVALILAAGLWWYLHKHPIR